MPGTGGVGAVGVPKQTPLLLDNRGEWTLCPKNEALRAVLSPCGEPPRVIAQAFARVRPPLREPLMCPRFCAFSACLGRAPAPARGGARSKEACDGADVGHLDQ